MLVYTSVVSSLSVVCVNVSSVSYSSCAITIMSCSSILECSGLVL